MPPARRPESQALALSVRGSFDRTKGEIVLSPIPGTSGGGGAVNLSAEGVHVSGLGSSSTGLMVSGGLIGDLAALDQVIAGFRGGATYGLAGSWQGKLTVRPQRDGSLLVNARVDSPDISRPVGESTVRQSEAPLSIGGTLTYLAATKEGGWLNIPELNVVTRYATVAVTGFVADPVNRRIADLKGTLSPNWSTLTALAASALEPGVTLQGGASRPFHIRGPLTGSSPAALLKAIDAEIGVDLNGTLAYGLQLGTTPLVLQAAGGRAGSCRSRRHSTAARSTSAPSSHSTTRAA